jgi:hypothetical protein
VHPPYAWTLLWMGTYSNRLGIWMPKRMQRWGYVFWDAVRMKGVGAKEVLEDQWQGHGNQDDPRRHLDSRGQVIPGTDADWHARGMFPRSAPKAGFQHVHPGSCSLGC